MSDPQKEVGIEEERAVRALTTAEHFLDANKPERALQALEPAASLLMTDPEFHLLRASAFLELARYGDAENAAQRGLKIEPAHAGLLYCLGRARHDVGDLPGAERAYLAGLEEDPER